MAAAKKIASKKAPARKVAAVKKTPAVKQAPARRQYRKKTEIVDEQMTAQGVVGIDLKDLEQRVLASGGSADGVQDTPPAEGDDQKNDPLLDADTIDLRGSDEHGRFHVAAWLEARGYVFVHDTSKPATASWSTYFTVAGLRLQHTNKLLTPLSAEEVLKGRAVTRLVDFRIDRELVLLDPQPLVPDTIQVDGAMYQRVAN